ncbi:MAG: phasin family protein [Lysobacteraceae bacterium]|nr:MAG: phasin family protein [Xanthomonadaceae bacterium]
MYQQFNEQFAKSTRQFADTTAQVSRLTLENTEAVFGLQLSTLEENMNATFAFWGDLAEVRDFDGLKAVWPKGLQIARENVEPSMGAGQEAFGRTLKTQEAIAKLAKVQFESAAATVQADAEKIVKAASRKAAR